MSWRGGQKQGLRGAAIETPPPLWSNSPPQGTYFTKGLEILIAVVFCKECVLPVQWWFLFCKGGEDGRGTDGGGGRAKSRIARPKLIIKSCVKMHMNSNIHNEFPAPLHNFLPYESEKFADGTCHRKAWKHCKESWDQGLSNKGSALSIRSKLMPQ